MEPPTLSMMSNTSLSNPSLALDQEQPGQESTFKVYVRCRPLSMKELQNENPKKRVNIIKKHDNMVFY